MIKVSTDRKVSLSRRIFHYFSGFTIFSFFLFGIIMFQHSIKDYKREVELMKKYFLETKKVEIKNNILNIKDYIHWVRNNPFQTLSHALPKHIEKLKFNELKIEINSKNSLQGITDSINQIDVPYCIINEKGNIIYSFSPAGKRMNENINDKKTKSLYSLIKKNPTGKYTFPLYSHTNSIDSVLHAIAYFDTNVMPGYTIASIVNSEYFDNLLQDYILDSLSNVRYAKDDYIFVNTIDGKTLINDGIYNKTPVNIFASRDTSWIKIFKAEQSSTTQQEGVFYTYTFRKISTGERTPKTSYFSYLPEWKWILGTGFYEDDVNSIIESERKKLYADMRDNLFSLSIFLLISFLLSYLASYFLSRHLGNNFKQFKTFFDKAAVDDIPIDETQVSYKEFKEMASDANFMVEKRKRTENALLKAEEKFIKAFRNSPDAIIISAISDGYIIDANDSASFISGYPLDEIIGNTSDNLDIWINNNDRNRYLSLIIESGKVENFEADVKMRSGEIRSGLFSGEIIQLGTDKYILSVIRDITELKKEEQLLRISEEKFRSILENSADAIFLADLHGNFTYTNKAVTNLLGYNPSEMLSKTILDISPAEESGKHLNLFKKLLTNGKLVTELEFIKKDGSLIYTDLNAVLLPDGMVYGSNRDVTERKKNQEELTKYRDHLEELVNERTEALVIARKEAEEANNLKSVFLANMSHEIRTPMNAVLGYTDLLSSILTDNTQKNYIESIKSSGRNLLTLINDILDLSKIEAGKLEFEFDFINSKSFFSEFERIFALKASEKGIRFIVETSPDTPAAIYVDESRLRQIIFNLIGNAIKFTNEGHVELKVRSENLQRITNKEGKIDELIDLIIDVEDTGIGISKEIIAEIFNPFTQARDHKNIGGTGLGLSITHRLTTLMNGTIIVKSEPGKGSIFTVKIPGIVFKRDLNITDATIQIDPSEVIFENATLLIVDDIETNRSYIRDVLKNTNITLIESEDGENAYELAKKIIPDLIISDIRLPGIDGFHLLNKIKANKKLKNIPVLAYSASVLKDQKDRIRQSKFAALLAKPVNITELYIELMNFLPYKMNKKVNHDQQVSDLKSMDKIIDFSGLLNSLETSFKETWKTFEIMQPIEEIRAFGESLINLGENHNSTDIISYGNELKNASESFNIEAILKLVRLFPTLVENIKISK